MSHFNLKMYFVLSAYTLIFLATAKGALDENCETKPTEIHVTKGTQVDIETVCLYSSHKPV